MSNTTPPRYYAAAYPYGITNPVRTLRVFSSILARSIWTSEARNRRAVSAADVTPSERRAVASLLSR
jgi:hypothetical protein